ncbi:MAG: hypothetical protein A3H97_10665 [Acidobacteria bacterium RIFCSPLOWO2_02_FULL_65_29]|nr:MAG: hypothetical protein A3H97_10665 [Acidobacteria bacterium RIFCSPLOWO2_02_FULL_65_29]
MRTTLTLDDDVYEAARALMEASGKTLGRVLSDLARRGLKPRSDFRSKRTLPVFLVPANAPVIPSTRARELEAEEPR